MEGEKILLLFCLCIFFNFESVNFKRFFNLFVFEPNSFLTIPNKILFCYRPILFTLKDSPLFWRGGGIIFR
jgi:hypothetical protein